MSLSTKNDTSGAISFKFVTPTLLAILIAIGSWFTSTVIADVTRIKMEAAAQKATVDLRIQTLESQIEGIRQAQDRSNKLLVKIATRMGIEVAE